MLSLRAFLGPTLNERQSGMEENLLAPSPLSKWMQMQETENTHPYQK